MCALIVYKRRKPSSSPIRPLHATENRVISGGDDAVNSSSGQLLSPVNGAASQLNSVQKAVDPSSSSDDDQLPQTLPADRSQRLTFLGIDPADFFRASSPNDCSSSSGVHPLHDSPSSPSSLMACKKCGIKSNPLKMLICDLCEGAFHMGCCKARRVPKDEWYCRPCQRKKSKVLPETLSGQLFYIMRQNKKRRVLREKLGPIMAMLADADGDLFTSAVPIGEKFQADVPDWTGPEPDLDTYHASASELPPADWWSLKTTSSRQSARQHSIGNWVQCRGMIYNEADEDDEGTICGKWRRVPLSVSQTEDWDCSCAVPWDPVHADCAVPQELETAQIMKQLKFIAQITLKGRLRDKGQKQLQAMEAAPRF